jgi:hypothetical protein
MKHTALTLMILQLNAMLDTGKFDDVTNDEVAEHIEAGDILTWLSKRGCDSFDASMFRDDGPYIGFEKFWVEHLQSLQSAHGDGGRKWGVRNRGLCLLIAWTNEALQMGEGWKPHGRD